LALETHLKEHTYLHAKDIVAYVKDTFGVEYSVNGMTRWLNDHNFSYKKPSVVPGKANRQAQEAWIKEYNELKASLKPSEAICFIDGVHPTHNAKPAFGWIKRGEDKTLLTNTGRQRLNLAGAIDICSRKVIVREHETLNAEATIEFLKKIEHNYPAAERIYVFCDNAGYYRNKIVKEFILTSKIEMRFLPPYSPNLNPIERLWKFMNEQILYNKYFEKYSDFREAVLGFLKSLFDPPKDLLEPLKRRITDCFHLSGTKNTAF
jgi:transposase